MQPAPSWIIPITPADSPDEILRKAASVVPSPPQLAWQRLELCAFIHFGINTFTDQEWGSGLEDPAVFNPADLDARQWTQALRAAGFRQVILTAKHHDGFCLWPSRYTHFSVASSPWRGGKGDVMAELAAAAREAGLKLGVYLSPADLHEMESPTGRYGNGSPAQASVIPTPVPGDDRPAGQAFTFTVNDYNRYYLNQLYELLTHYGPIHEVWFDGANPKPGVQESYAYHAWFRLVRLLAPDAVMFNGPDIRWVGNESGLGRETEWSPLPFRGDPQPGLRPLDPLAEDLGSRERLFSGADYLAWSPAEVDVSIRPGWFYHAEQDEQVKSLEHLLHIYLASVGRNGVLLLNIPPDRRGLFTGADLARLAEFGAALERIFAHNLAQGALVQASSTAVGSPASIVDASSESIWMPLDNDVQPELVLELTQKAVINFIVLQESLAVGQRVEHFCVDAWTGDSWRTITAGTTIGYKRILPIDTLESQRFRLCIQQSRLAPAISLFALY